MSLSDKFYLAGLAVLFAPVLVGLGSMATPWFDRWHQRLKDAQAISWLLAAGLFLAAYLLEP